MTFDGNQYRCDSPNALPYEVVTASENDKVTLARWLGN